MYYFVCFRHLDCTEYTVFEKRLRKLAKIRVNEKGPPRRFLATYLTTILICVFAPWQVAVAQATLFRSDTVQPHPVNLDFEQGTIGQLPEGWDSPTTGCVAELSEDKARSGKLPLCFSARIRFSFMLRSATLRTTITRSNRIRSPKFEYKRVSNSPS